MSWRVGEVCLEGAPAPGPDLKGRIQHRRGCEGGWELVFSRAGPVRQRNPQGSRPMQSLVRRSTAEPQRGPGQAPTPAQLG